MVQVVEHVRVLVAAQPLVFPVKAQGLPAAQEALHGVFVFKVAAVDVFVRVAGIVQTFVKAEGAWLVWDGRLLLARLRFMELLLALPLRLALALSSVIGSVQLVL